LRIGEGGGASWFVHLARYDYSDQVKGDEKGRVYIQTCGNLKEWDLVENLDMDKKIILK